MNDKTYSLYAKALEELTLLKTNPPVYSSYGICRNVSIDVGALIVPFFPKWEHYSGNDSSPIPSPDKRLSEYEAFDLYPLWDKKTAYGKLRYDLLDFLIKEIESYFISDALLYILEWKTQSEIMDEKIFLIDLPLDDIPQPTKQFFFDIVESKQKEWKQTKDYFVLSEFLSFILESYEN